MQQGNPDRAARKAERKAERQAERRKP